MHVFHVILETVGGLTILGFVLYVLIEGWQLWLLLAFYGPILAWTKLWELGDWLFSKIFGRRY